MKKIGLINNRCDDFLSCSALAIDIETKDTGLMELGPSIWRGGGHIVGVSLANDSGNTYLELRHPDTSAETREANERYILDVLRSSSTKVGANLLYDLMWLSHTFGEVNGSFRDVQYAEPVIDEYRASYSLSALCQYYGEPDKGTQELITFCRDQGWPFSSPLEHLWRMPSFAVADYASWDAQSTWNIYKKQAVELESQGLDRVYDLECGLIPILLKMRQIGVRIDKKKMASTRAFILEKSAVLEKEIQSNLGHINIGSSAQLAEAFIKRGIPVPRNPLTEHMLQRGITVGNPSLDKDALTILAKDHPVCLLILSLRHYNTLLSLFFDPYRKYIHGDRIRCQFHPLRTDKYGTVSGRFSSSTPNLQQVSGTSDDDEDAAVKGKFVRDLFIPEEGLQWAKLDYSQVEYRLQAHYALGAGSDEVREAYNSDPNTDFHQRVMDSTGVTRRDAKALNFGASYGMGEDACAKANGWTKDEATHFMRTYHAKNPYVRTTRKAVMDVAQRRGYIKTLLGRRARVHPSRKLHSMYNRLIQGSAADVMKKAMVDAWGEGLFNVLPLHLTVHDELDISFDPNDTLHREALVELKHTMETAIPCRVPLICPIEAGPSWGTLNDLTEEDLK